LAKELLGKNQVFIKQNATEETIDGTTTLASLLTSTPILDLVLKKDNNK
jgi:hypothetical protein